MFKFMPKPLNTLHICRKSSTHDIFIRKKLRHPQRSDKSKSRNKETQAIVHLCHLFHSQRDKSLIFINIDCLETCLKGGGEREELVLLLKYEVNAKYHCTFTFACGDRNICDQGVQFVWGVLVLITFPGQTYAQPVRHIPGKN